MLKICVCLLLLQSVPIKKTVPSPNKTSSIKIRITGIKDIQGVLKIGLYDSRKGFEEDRWIKGVNVKVKSRMETVDIDSVKVGSYALKIFQDLNENDILDKNFLGIPTEPFAFSNNAKGLMGPPDYTDCIFNVTREKEDFTINF